MDKNEFIQNYQDRLRGKDANPLTKAVVTRKAAPEAMLSAAVSPCSWMNLGSPFQITVQMAGGGMVIVQDKALAFDQATVSDMQRMLDEVEVIECSCFDCKRPAFAPSKIPSNREGKCEACFMRELDATIGQEIRENATRRKQALAEEDAAQRARGHTHRVNAIVHRNGDDLDLVIYMSNPLKAQILKELRANGCATGEYVKTKL